MINEWMKTLLSLSVSGALLLLLLLGLKRFYQNRFSRQWQYYILLLVALRFLLPVTPGAADAGIVGSLFHKLEKPWSAAEDATGVPAEESGAGILTTEQDPVIFFPANTDRVGETYVPVDEESTSPTGLSPVEANTLDISACLFSVWAAVALILFVRRITIYRDFVRLIRAGNREISDRRILNLLSGCREKLHVRARVELSRNPLVTSPVMIGFFRPNIILPAGEAEDDTLFHIFLHELVHYKQKDMFYKWLIQTVICLHWFNPFVYLLEKEVNRACELSCDEKVLLLLDEKARRGYGDTLLSFFKQESPYKNSQAFVSLTEGAVQLKERLGAIMKFKKKTKSVIIATVILSAILCVCFWETGAYVAAHASGDMSANPRDSAPDADRTATGENGKAPVISGQSTDTATVLPGPEADASSAVIPKPETGASPAVIPKPETGASSAVNPKPAADLEDLKFNIVKTVSDERCLYLYFSMKANEGARLAQDGQFADYEMYFPGKMTMGAYQQYFLDREDGVPENELEGVIYADWQADANAERLEIRFANWMEKKMHDDVKVDFNVSEMVAEAGENAELPLLCLRTPYHPNFEPPYLWQPGDADIELPCSGVTICNAGWENGILQIVMSCTGTAVSGRMYQNWYFVDTRTDEVIQPETITFFHTRGQFEPTAGNPDDYYVWKFVSVDREALPYLEMHWGGKEILTPVLSGEWKVSTEETPVMEKSKLLAEDFKLSYAGRELHVDRIECSSLSLGIYFTDYVDSTTGILDEFAAFDTDGNPININWGFTAAADRKICMIWTRFAEPFDPESICLLTFDGEPIMMKSKD